MPSHKMLRALFLVVIFSLCEGDVVLQCNVKYGREFCDRLGAACSQLTGTAIPQVTMGSNYELPQPIVNCIASENYVAMCYARYGNSQCLVWFNACRQISSSDIYELTASERECVTSLQILVKLTKRCSSSPNLPFCANLKTVCSQYLGPNQSEKTDVMTLCINRYGTDACNNMVVSCYTLTNIPNPENGTKRQLPEIIINCMFSEIYNPSVIWQCIQKYGSKSCKVVIEKCYTSTGSSLSKKTPWILAPSLSGCITTGMMNINVNSNVGIMSQCITTYGNDFCNQMLSSCSVLTNVPFATVGVGGQQQIPTILSSCMASEMANPSIMWQCVQRFGVTTCKTLLGSCFTSTGATLSPQTPWVIPSTILTCITSGMNNQNTRVINPVVPVNPGVPVNPLVQINQLVPVNPVVPVIPINQGGPSNTVDVMSQCTQKYGVNFCNNLGASCSSLTNVAFVVPGFGGQQLPPMIRSCISYEMISPSVMSQCVAKYGSQFCKNLLSNCLSSTGATLPMQSPWQIPPVVSSCITSGMAKGTDHNKKDVMATCIQRYGADFCKNMVGSCAALTDVTLTSYGIGSVLPQVIVDCMTSEMSSPSIMWQCVQKYGTEFCKKLLQDCSASTGASLSPQAPWLIPSVIAECMAKGMVNGGRQADDTMAICIQKYGIKFCNIIGAACSVLTQVPFFPQLPGTVQQLPSELRACVRSETQKPNVMTKCVEKYGTEFCSSLLQSCSASTGAILPLREPWKIPHPIADCMYAGMNPESEEDRGGIMSKCIRRYGFDFCKKMLESCSALTSVQHDSRNTNYASLPQVLKDCMASEMDSPSVMFECVQRYGTSFCKGLLETCTEKTRASLSPQAPWLIPTAIAQCMRQGMNQGDEKKTLMSLCVRRYGADYCNNLAAACSVLTNLPFFPQTPPSEQNLPPMMHKCLKSEMENPGIMSTCVQRYGTQFCKNLLNSCTASTGRHLPYDAPWKIPEPIAACMAQGMNGGDHKPKEDAMARCIRKYGVTYCNNMLASCSVLTNVNYDPSGGQMPGILSECVTAETDEPSAMCQCVQKYGTEFCKKRLASCIASTGMNLPATTPWKLPPPVARCMQHGSPNDNPGQGQGSNDVMSQCIARYGAEFCQRLARFCYAMNSLQYPGETFNPQQQTPTQVARCMKSEMDSPSVMWHCVQKYGQEFCNKLAATCSTETNTPLPQQDPWRLPQPIIACMLGKMNNPNPTSKPESVMSQCRARYGDDFCLSLGKACAELNNVPSSMISLSAQQLPQPVSSCMKAEMNNPSALWQCIQQYGIEFCKKLRDACSAMTGASLSTTTPWILPQPVSNCMRNEMNNPSAMWLCIQKYGIEFCNRLASACAMIKKVTMPTVTINLPEIIASCVASENSQAMCYARKGPEQCKTEENICRNPNNPPGSPLTIPETECMKSQVAMATCQKKFGSECVALQQECVAGTGAPPVTIGARGAFMLATALRSCIFNGGVIGSCVLYHPPSQCDQWVQQCATALQTSAGVTVAGGYRQLSPPMAICVTSQDLMTRCMTRLGQTACQQAVKNCKRRFNTPSSRLPGRLWSLSSELINCLYRPVNRASN